MKVGSELIILHGNPINLIPTLTEIIKAEGVIWNRSIEPTNRNKDHIISEILKKKNKKVITQWDQLIVSPNEIYNSSGLPYKVYGPFWKKWKLEAEVKYSQISNLNCLCEENYNQKIFYSLSEHEKEKIKNILNKNLILNPKNVFRNIRDANHFSTSDLCPCLPGELAGRKQLKDFLEKEYIYKYKDYRDRLDNNKTSRVSAALNLGTISPLNAWSLSKAAMQIAILNSDKESIIAWQKELCWREFYKHILFHFPHVETGAFKEKWNKFPWNNNKVWLKAWEKGLTGIPIIDAAMRQLIQTGWMHNRARMIVASFLIKDLMCSWQLGEKLFMDLLVDGDLAANNGGWQWSANCGVDTKQLRIFNPYRQAQRFDPKGDYIKRWLPELSHISYTDLVNGSILEAERKFYPKPIVNHDFQQSNFRRIYKEFIISN